MLMVKIGELSKDFCLKCGNGFSFCSCGTFRVYINIDKLVQELIRLEFDDTYDSMTTNFGNTARNVYDIWKDDDGEWFVTVDICVEIPIRACTFL